MTGQSGDIIDRAIAWHLRRREMTADDWRAFTVWMSEAEAHAEAFDRIALDDSLFDISCARDIAQPVPACGVKARSRLRQRWPWAVAGSGIAAGLALAIIPIGMQGDPAYEVSTRPGEQRTLTLGDGTRIEMSGGTRLALRHDDMRFAQLKSGEATFHVRHDEQNPFTLHSGGLTIRDLGTVFNVAREGAQMGVQVAEGAVMFQPDAEAVVLKPGSTLSTKEGGDQILIGRVDPAMVGGWRHGRLAFSGTALGDVMKAVRRQSGVRIDLDSSLASRPFTGTIRLTGSAEKDVSHIAALIGASARHSGEGWAFEMVGHNTP